ncbi:hypothetical protein D9V34_08020 [Mycetocola lacteus]|uniref:Uncharacterized protein n=1 Tax=Mycetocola lacteus TaxID=76637 RepID=A0A3L7AUK1_9MICO|nr:hypothetical protein [Mycetocola lacteus]RLP83168.1 hypothetical protein D9V34_08020 [Mycetocola lacteus]
MSHFTHLTKSNAVDTAVLSDRVQPLGDEIRRLLRRLDGDDQSTILLFRRPPGVHYLDLIWGTETAAFLQSGGARARLSIDIRFVDDEGRARQYLLGHRGGRYRGEPDTDLSFFGGNGGTSVYAHEVFEAEEAAVVYSHYIATGWIPDGFLLREVRWPRVEGAPEVVESHTIRPDPQRQFELARGREPEASTTSHWVQTNAEAEEPIDGPGLAPEDKIGFGLEKLDGGWRWGFRLRRNEPEQPLRPIDPDFHGPRYLAALGTANALALYARLVDADGATHLVAIGRTDPQFFGDYFEGAPPLSLALSGGPGWIEVFPGELFTSAEAFEIFRYYTQTDRLPDGFHLRRLPTGD